jgi:glycosyltransferase involved in cell wall biosynthesis
MIQLEEAKTGVRGQRSDLTGRTTTVCHQSPIFRPQVAILTAGRDRPYALGLASALISSKIPFDYIASDGVDGPELHDNSCVRVLKFRDQREDAGWLEKVTRVLVYYWRLVRYAATAEPRVFHILWNNKFELFDRTVLMFYYRLLGKRVVLTAHNVNMGKRDLNDSWLNRASLRVQYGLSDCIFVHTEAMKRELTAEYAVPESKVIVIPFGINNTVPKTNLSATEARHRVGIGTANKAILFFGNIAPYKGLECLVAAFKELVAMDASYRLIIVGKPKGRKDYWGSIKLTIEQGGIRDKTIQVIEYVPDEATELYFKAADVLVLPYTRIFQSGVIFLGYSFGLPVIAADVGSLKEEIIEGKTGFKFKPQDSVDLTRKIEQYFASDLFANLERTRGNIKAYANERYSWDKVAAITTGVYAQLLARCPLTTHSDLRSPISDLPGTP